MTESNKWLVVRKLTSTINTHDSQTRATDLLKSLNTQQLKKIYTLPKSHSVPIKITQPLEKLKLNLKVEG